MSNTGPSNHKTQCRTPSTTPCSRKETFRFGCLVTYNGQVPPFGHRLNRHKPTAWSEALAGMMEDAPPEARKGSGEKHFTGSYTKWVSQNWMERKGEFEEKARLKKTQFGLSSKREGCQNLLNSLECQVCLHCSCVIQYN
jgi:hypothetical protein